MKGFTFDPEVHRYYYEGKHVPNVTSLLQEYGLINFDGIPKERLDYKSALGTAVHRCIELHNAHNLDEESIDPRIKPYFMSYKKFTEVHKYEPRFTEHRLYSKKWKFAGTIDSQGLFYWKGKEVEAIIDWKCVWAMSQSNGPQTAAYKILWDENNKVKIQSRFGLQLKETGNFEVYEYTDPNDKQDFLACLWLWWQSVNKYRTVKTQGE